MHETRAPDPPDAGMVRPLCGAALKGLL